VIALVDEAVSSGARRAQACEMLELSARTVERWRACGGGEDGRRGPTTVPSNKLSQVEKKRLLDTMNSPEYRDLSPNQIVPKLADAGVYIASESTMYRVLREEGLQNHREPSHPPVNSRPDPLVADGPNLVWSWDITYLPAAVRGMFFYLYMVMDVWSRKIVGWEVHREESMELSSRMISRICEENGINESGLNLHSDNGGPMKGSTMLATLQQLGIVASFSRPSVSDDNPYSEALFRTLKYRPEYPKKPFESLEAARAWVAGFVRWYNTEHLHSGIKFVTPADRHAGLDTEILRRREAVYEAAKTRTPERWSGETRNWEPVETVDLNPEKPSAKEAA
jgi:transposase InsO family protein